MAELPANVTVGTYQTRFTNADSHDTMFDFQRIAAIEDASGRLITCADIGKFAVGLEWRSLPFKNRDQADRFVRYFTERIAPNDTTLHDAEHRSAADYNCHSFRHAIVEGGDWLGWRDALDQVQKYIGRCIPFVRRLALGQSGFVVGEDDRRDDFIYHSFLGLGEDTTDCLCVYCIGGPVMIAPVWNMANDYVRRFPKVVMLPTEETS